MPKCKLCNKEFPNRIKIDNKIKNVCKRKYCLSCSPFGLHNTSRLLSSKIKSKRLKRCSKCQKLLPLNKFYRRYYKKTLSIDDDYNNRITVCKDCSIRYSTDRYIMVKKKAISYLGGKCKRCGFNESYVSFCFHHRNPNEKEFNWKQLRGLSWKLMIKELNKCDLLCLNCHTIVHFDLGL